jgi:hypothetical protein
LAILFGAAALIGGCSSMDSVKDTAKDVVHLQQRVPPTEEMNNSPVMGDGAMALRQWDPTPGFYVNDAVWAWPNYSPLQPGPLPYEMNILTEPVLFLANLVYIPAGVFLEPPFILEVYKSISPPPSYNVMPPLPGGAEPIPN